MHTVPAVQKAVSNTDALMGFFDAWALCRQLLRYLEEGDGRELFKDAQPVAIAAVRQLDEEAGVLYQQMLPLVESGQLVMFTSGESVITAMVFTSPYLPELTVQVVAWRSPKPLLAVALLRRVVRWAQEVGAARVIALTPGKFPVRGWMPRETYHEFSLSERKVA